MNQQPTATNILRLLSQLEACCHLTNHMAFDDDNHILDQMKQRYYNLYSQTKKYEVDNTDKRVLQ